MSVVAHVAKRLALALLGYFVATIVGLVAIAAIYGLLASLPNAPGYFDWVSISPLVALVVPTIGLLVLLIAYMVTLFQMLAVLLITEIFSLRYFWLHMIFGALVASSGFLMVSPTTATGIDGSDIADLAIIAMSGLVAGLIYWLIAGRDAGFRRASVPVMQI